MKKPDIILTPSPPLTSGLISILLARIKGSKSIYNVQEIYPDLLINHGRLTNPFIIKFLKILEVWVYNWSDSVTTIDQNFYNTIKSRIRNLDKLKIISNFVDTELYKQILQCLYLNFLKRKMVEQTWYMLEILV